MTEENTDYLYAPDADLLWLQEQHRRLKEEIHSIIVGQEDMIDLLMIALLVNGHILLEGVPGIGKTLTARLFAKAIKAPFKRIQFTPDLMPADIIGTMVFNTRNVEFEFKPGPLFSNLVLIDEVNRAPAKTQAALFEVMQERQVTVDGTSYPMQFPYLVLATQNPIEQEGTYKLPEAQLDRFHFRIEMDYPSLEEEKAILRRFNNPGNTLLLERIEPVFDGENLKRAQSIVAGIHIKDDLLDYIAEIIHRTRATADLFLGASPRASLAIMHSAKAKAALHGRRYVLPEDIKELAYPVLNHRIILSADKEIQGIKPNDIIRQLIETIPVPR
ncbi:MAG: MoxR family ATPase [Saprospiraceae bacterium]|nr:MoxR family ATPase [Saprospiraceae bacterium]MCB9318557.1 MoxR family ATPase [Lewinellaceae bacterium]